MRGRKPPKVRVPRTPRRKANLDGLPRIVAPWCDNRVGVVVEAGSDQSLIRWLDDQSEDHLPHEGCYPNDWFRPYRERLKSDRVRINEKRERLPLKRERLKAERVRL
jgi:hypothetical protein